MKDEIETALGFRLSWEKLENKRACRIAVYREGDINGDTETLVGIRNWMIDSLLKMKAVFPPRIMERLSALELEEQEDDEQEKEG